MTGALSPQDKLADLHARLADEVAALRSGDDWRRWLTAAARLHEYSFQNTLLILSQRPDASTVAGYETWKALGRQVNRGEKGIAIMAPILRRKPAEEPATVDGRDQQRPAVTGFRVTYVWDISQTTGPPLPDRPTPQLLRGHAPDGLWDAMAEIVEDVGFRLERRSAAGANGLTDFGDHVVRVRPDVDDAQAVKTLAHELGHIRLHAPDDAVSLPGRMPCLGLIEVEAESVAYLVATAHGLDTGSYTFPYVVGWAGDVTGYKPEEVVRITGERVLSAARWVLARTETAVHAQEQPRQEHEQVAAHRRPTRTSATSPGSALVDAGVPKERLLEVHAETTAFFRAQLDSSWIPAYLRCRGLEAALDAPWSAGRAPAGWTSLLAHLRAKGADDETLLASGLAIRARTGKLIDTFRDRLVLPLLDDQGQVVGFIGRAHPDASRRTPKYINSPTTALYRKGEHLYGLFEGRELLRRGGVPVLVEGPFDAVAVTLALDGRGAGFATCGTALTPAHLDSIGQHVDLASSRLVVGFDNDPAGHRAAAHAANVVAARGLSPLAVTWTSNDPANVLQREGAAELLDTVVIRARPLADLIVHRQPDVPQGLADGWMPGRAPRPPTTPSSRPRAIR